MSLIWTPSVTLSHKWSQGTPLEKIWLLVWNVICISEGVLSVLELEESEDDFNDYEDDVFHLESHHGEYECEYGE